MNSALIFILLFASSISYATAELDLQENFARVEISDIDGDARKLMHTMNVELQGNEEFQSKEINFNFNAEPVFSLYCVQSRIANGKSHCRMNFYNSKVSSINFDRRYFYMTVREPKEVALLTKLFSHEGNAYVGTVFNSSEGNLSIWKVIDSWGNIVAFVIRYTETRPY